MNKKERLPILAQILESGHNLSITHDFPVEKIPIFGDQIKEQPKVFYVQPLSEEWHEYSILGIPYVIRFNYDSDSINTEDYSSPMPPPPPPPAQSTLTWVIISSRESIYLGDCPDGTTSIILVWGLLVTNIVPPVPGSNIYAQVREVSCCDNPAICDCYPDCTFGGTEGVDDLGQPVGDYATYIYSYPCGHYPSFPNGGYASGCSDPNVRGFGGGHFNPSNYGQV